MTPVPRRAVPVFVMKLEDGNFSMISSARLEGGTGLVDIERLFYKKNDKMKIVLYVAEKVAYALMFGRTATNALVGC